MQRAYRLLNVCRSSCKACRVGLNELSESSKCHICKDALAAPALSAVLCACDSADCQHGSMDGVGVCSIYGIRVKPPGELSGGPRASCICNASDT